MSNDKTTVTVRDNFGAPKDGQSTVLEVTAKGYDAKVRADGSAVVNDHGNVFETDAKAVERFKTTLPYQEGVKADIKNYGAMLFKGAVSYSVNESELKSLPHKGEVAIDPHAKPANGR